MRNLMTISGSCQGSLYANHSRSYKEGGHKEIDWQELAPPQWEHLLLHNQKQTTQRGLMKYREYQADYYQNRQNLENMSMQLLYQNALCNNLKELQAQNSGVHGNAPEYLEQYGGIAPGYKRTPEVKPLTNIQEQTKIGRAHV